MEPWESVGPRPRQARYQAALRPEALNLSTRSHRKRQLAKRSLLGGLLAASTTRFGRPSSAPAQGSFGGGLEDASALCAGARWSAASATALIGDDLGQGEQ